MARLTLRLVPFAATGGAENMARDEYLARFAAHSLRPALRFYAWSQPTLSLGYFQPHAVRRESPAWERIPWVRRPSGGAALLHHFELTYCLAMPRDIAGNATRRWLERCHASIVEVLATLGVQSALATEDAVDPATCLCFCKITVNDVVCQGHKIAGSAQRRYSGAVLQHGSILLRRSPLAPLLPGIAELTGKAIAATDLAGALSRHVASKSGWSIEEGDWEEAELKAIAEIRDRRYRNANWNQRR